MHLAGLAWVYDEPLEARAVGALPAERRGHVTFLCANKPLKVTPEAVAAWAKVLGAVPDFRLNMLLDEKGQSAKREKSPTASAPPATLLRRLRFLVATCRFPFDLRD
jgi:predicted O-linked N-acetylglucosamine transferase (SPINDLY family)